MTLKVEHTNSADETHDPPASVIVNAPRLHGQSHDFLHQKDQFTE